MGYFPVIYDPRVVIYERKMFIRLAADHTAVGRSLRLQHVNRESCKSHSDLSPYSTKEKKPWSSGYGRRLMFRRS